MNGNVNKQLAELLEKINSGIDFSVATIPSALEQVMAYQIFQFWVCFGILFLSVSILSFLALNMDKIKNESVAFTLLTFGIIGTFFGIIGSVSEGIEAAKVVYFPEAWLLDYARSVLNK